MRSPVARAAARTSPAWGTVAVHSEIVSIRWLKRSSCRPRCPSGGPAWIISLLFLLPVLGLGADEESPKPRSILGGAAVSAQDYPFMVWVRTYAPHKSDCSGTLVAPTWVLTAAHCVNDLLVPTCYVTSDGSLSCFRGEQASVYYPTWHRFERRSKRVIVHPDYRLAYPWGRGLPPRTGYEHDPGDVALIELESAFPASVSASPIGIASLSAEKKYAPSDVTAGLLGFSGADIEFISFQHVTTTLYSAADCRARLDLDNEILVHDDTICAGRDLKRAERGDSGGALIVTYSADGVAKNLQVGVISHVGVAARTDSAPTIADSVTTISARISSYADWIRTTTGGAVSPIVFTSPAEPEPDETEQLTTRLSTVNTQIRSLQDTVQALQGNRALLKQRIDEFKGADGKDKKLQTTEDGILSSASALLPQ